MPAIVDTGPLVAFFDRAERHHRWVAGCIEELEAPLLVCEPVLTEVMYLLGRYLRAQDALFELLLTVREAQEDGTWARLKVCANPECRSGWLH